MSYSRKLGKIKIDRELVLRWLDYIDHEIRDVKFDIETTWSWQYLGDDRDIRRIEAEARILEAIEILGSCYAKDIANELGISCPTIYGHLKRMRTEGKVEYEMAETKSGKQFRYKLPENNGATSPTRLPSAPESEGEFDIEA